MFKYLKKIFKKRDEVLVGVLINTFEVSNPEITNNLYVKGSSYFYLYEDEMGKRSYLYDVKPHWAERNPSPIIKSWVKGDNSFIDTPSYTDIKSGKLGYYSINKLSVPIHSMG